MVLKTLFTGQQWRNRQGIDLWTRGEGEMYGESNMETYITIWKLESQREFALCLRKVKRALCQPRGVGWEGDGREVRKGGERCIPMANSC